MNTDGAVVLDRPQPAPVRPSLAEVREMKRLEWKIGALGNYVALLVRLYRRQPAGHLLDRIERALAEGDRTEAQLVQAIDALADAQGGS